ncbi:MAG: hypothetical protein NUW37_00745 [Planctomycetes bacterium]|nr:hypothetical protein [Planctomycetota bacterium]
MNSLTTERFWKCYSELSKETRKRAKKAYRLFRENTSHPSLHFKQVHSTRPIYSVRITMNCRAVGIVQGENIIWFWIGTHSEYDNLLQGMRKA